MTKLVKQTPSLIRVDAVPTPLAPSTILGSSCNQVLLSYTSLSRSFDTLMKADIRLYYVAYLQFSFGLRISEVLKIRHYDISSIGLILIKGSKKSKNQVINCPELTDYLRSCKQYKINPFEDFDRHFVYRQYKKAGLMLPATFGQFNAVTHLFRYIAVQEIGTISKEFTDKSDFLRHKSPNSTKHYDKK